MQIYLKIFDFMKKIYLLRVFGYNGTMKSRIQVAIADIGAGSGRIIRGSFDGKKLELEEVHRFLNGYVALQGGRYWDILMIWKEITDGLRKASSPDAPVSISVDTWGADFCEFDASGKLLGLPYSYRDTRTKGMVEKIGKILGEKEWRQITGIQPMDHITVCQLYANKEQLPARFTATKHILYMADAIHYFLTGIYASDFTSHSCTAVYDWRAKRFSDSILTQLGIDGSIFAPEQESGTVLGGIAEDVARDLVLPRAKVVMTGGHDSGLLPMLLPEQNDTCLLNCGTWGVIGYHSGSPHERTDVFVNFGAAGGGYLVCKIFNAMWYLQECKRQWDLNGQGLTYSQLEESATASTYEGIFDVEAPCFSDSTDMAGAIIEYMKRTGQPEPGSHGDFTRAILRSIALQCAVTLSVFEQEAGKCFKRFYFAGGANRNHLFCRMLADITGKELIIGTSEATAYANGCVQLAALGELKMSDIPGFAEKETTISPENYSPETSVEKYLELRENGGL